MAKKSRSSGALVPTSRTLVSKSPALVPKYHQARINGALVKFPVDRVYAYARMVGGLGGDSRTLARKLGVKHTVLLRWMDEDSEILGRLQRGLDLMVNRVEATAFKIALGYKNVGTKVQKIKDANGKVVRKFTTKTVDNVAPDGAMVKFLLQQRQRASYPSTATQEGMNVTIKLDDDDADL